MSVFVNVVCYQVRGLCDELVPRPEESYRVCVCVSLSVIRCNNNPPHLQWVGRSDHTMKERKKERKNNNYHNNLRQPKDVLYY
jgi:hypothetical protein